MHSKSFLRLSRLLTISVLSIVLMGCFDTGNGKDPVLGIPQIAKGNVVFSNVSGLTYKTLIPEGVADPDGEYIEAVTGPDSVYNYYPGEMVTFSVGDISTGILLGIVKGATRITAVELTGSNEPTDLAALRLLRFVMSLDLDQLYVNGITIEDPSRANGLTLDFYEPDDSVFEDQLENAVDIITDGANSVISEDDALSNFCYSYLFGGGQDVFGFAFEGCALGPDEELLQNPGFEEPADAPVNGSACSNRWTCFNDALTVPTGTQAPLAFEGNQMLKIFGPFFPEGGAGAFQDFTPVPGSEYTASVQAQNWDGENIDDANVAIMQLVFSMDGNFLDGEGETAFEVDASGAFGTNRTYLDPNIWTELKLTAKAPLNTVAARFVLLHIQIPGDAGGSIFYDQASVIGPTIEPPSVEYELVWSDEFDDPQLNESFWNVEEGYGVWSVPGGNNEWQLYTSLPENLGIVYGEEDPNDTTNGYLQISALCKDLDGGATVATLAAGGAALLAAGPELLTNGGFDEQDASSGDIPGSAGWNGFNSFTTNPASSGGASSPDADTPDNSLKAFGTGGGASQTFPATGGDEFTASGVGMNFSGDALTGGGEGFLQIVFRNAAGDYAGTAAGGNAAPDFNIFNGNVINASTPQDVWTALSVTGLAPDDTATVEFFVLKIGSGGGSVFFDSVSLTQTVLEPPDAELLTNGGFDEQDASSGDIPGSAGWNGFNSFTTNPASSGGASSPDADTPDNSLKAFGTGGGASQTFPATGGDEFTASGVGMNFSGDALTGGGEGFLQIVFRNAAGDYAGTAAGGNAAPDFNIFNGNVINASTPQDVWTALSVTGLAPDDTATVEFFVLKIGSGGGSVFFDSVSLTQAGVEPSDCVAGDKDDSVTSARINTLGKKDDIRYGKIVGRIKPPVGKAAWPAFWMLGTNEPDIGWPKSGEIDITEIWTSGVGDSGNSQTTHATLHWCPYSDADEETIGNCVDDRVFEGGYLNTGSSLGADFHEFEAVWDPGRIIFYIDGDQVWSRVIDPNTMEEFNNDFYLILNLAMGGQLGSDNQPPDPNGANWELPQRMLVDWVRIYQAVAP